MAQPITYGDRYAVDEEAIRRRYEMAKALQLEGQQTPKNNEMAGGWVINNRSTSLGNALKTLSGAWQTGKADEAAKELQDKKQTEYRNEAQQFAELLKGKAANSDVMQSNQSMDSFDPTPAVAGDKAKALAMALSANNPHLQQVGTTALAASLKDQEYGTTPHYDQSGKAYVVSKDGKPKYLGEIGQRDEIVADKLGDRTTFRSKYGTSPVAQATIGVGPDTVFNRNWDAFKYGNLSADQAVNRDQRQQSIGIEGNNSYFNTGMQPPQSAAGAMGAPQAFAPNQPPPQIPRGATPPIMPLQGQPGRVGMQIPPQIQAERDADRIRILQAEAAANPNDPRLAAELANAQSGRNYAGLGAGGAPVSMGTQVTAPLTPKAQAHINQETAQLNMTRTRDADAVLPMIKQAREILPGAHGSGVGNILGGVQNFTNIPLGQQDKNSADAKLQVLSGALVSKMPKMSGPQSDKDVMLYKQMAGDVGNAAFSIEQRLAALDEVQRLNEQYTTGFRQSSNAPQTGSNVSSGKIRVVSW